MGKLFWQKLFGNIYNISADLSRVHNFIICKFCLVLAEIIILMLCQYFGNIGKYHLTYFCNILIVHVITLWNCVPRLWMWFGCSGNHIWRYYLKTWLAGVFMVHNLILWQTDSISQMLWLCVTICSGINLPFCATHSNDNRPFLFFVTTSDETTLFG